ncbi:hypothetical protein FRB90_011468 [Tulasnella sp. 427]|nr:hypothetical protein FRB90_011468 [Tulasnella sp. 427]
MAPLIQALEQFTPELKDLALVAELTPHIVPPDDVIDLACLLRRRDFEEVVLHDAAIASPQILTALTESQSLQRLAFLSLDNILHSLCSSSIVGCGFPALTSISGQFMTAWSMLQAAPFSHLQEISVRYPMAWSASPRSRLSWSWDSIRVFIEVVADHAPALRFFHFNLAANDIEPSTQEDGPCALLPLARCKSLQILDIDLQDAALDSPGSPNIFNPTDEDWQILCKSWPQVNCLWYSCGPNQSFRSHTPPFNPIPKATTQTLLHLLKNCRALQTVNIPLRVTRSGVASCLAEVGNVHHSALIEMEAWGSHIEPECVEDLASFLATVAENPQFGLFAPVCSQLALGPAQPPHHYDEVRESLAEEELDRCRAWRRVVALLRRSRHGCISKNFNEGFLPQSDQASAILDGY